MLCAKCELHRLFSFCASFWFFFLFLFLFRSSISSIFCSRFWNFQCGTAWFVNEIETCAIFFFLPSFHFFRFVFGLSCIQQQSTHPPLIMLFCCYAITSARNCEQVDEDGKKCMRATRNRMHANVHRTTYTSTPNTQINIKSASECVFRIVEISRMIKLKWGQQQIHAKQRARAPIHSARGDFRSFVYFPFSLSPFHFPPFLSPDRIDFIEMIILYNTKKSLIYFYCNWYTQEICVYARRYGAVSKRASERGHRNRFHASDARTHYTI